jgi:hypothetical protein
MPLISLVTLRYFPATEPTREQTWNQDTILERTKDVIFTYAGVSKGVISAKPKAGVLFKLKDGIYWWASRFIPSFFHNFAMWHAYSTAAIHKAAIEQNFETGWLEKNNLTDAELDLFWYQLQRKSMANMNIEDWRQHFVAWVLVWVTSMRPGSFTVADGYEAGALITVGRFQEVSETLRWRDLVFFRVPEAKGGGIGVRITWLYMKGYRNPHKPQQTGGVRKHTILPLQSNRYHQDLALLLVSLAYSRGLFQYESLYEFFNGNETELRQVPVISDLAVFVAAKQSNGLTAEPMTEQALNLKLREMCDMVGLYGRNTMYSFRRGAIVDSRRKLSTEEAQQIASHREGGGTIYSYDESPEQDQDLANLRGGTERMSKADIRETFSQALTKRVVVDSEEMAPITGAKTGEDQGRMIWREAVNRADNDPQTTVLENTISTAFSNAKQLLIAKSVDPDMMFNRMDIIDQLKSFVARNDAECVAALATIEDAKHELKTTLRVLRRGLRVTIKTQWMKEAEKSQRFAAGTQRAALGDSLRTQSAMLSAPAKKQTRSTRLFDSFATSIPWRTMRTSKTWRTSRVRSKMKTRRSLSQTMPTSPSVLKKPTASKTPHLLVAWHL